MFWPVIKLQTALDKFIFHGFNWSYHNSVVPVRLLNSANTAEILTLCLWYHQSIRLYLLIHLVLIYSFMYLFWFDLTQLARWSIIITTNLSPAASDCFTQILTISFFQVLSIQINFLKPSFIVPGASDILTKNEKLILGLMWQLVQHFHVFQVEHIFQLFQLFNFSFI